MPTEPSQWVQDWVHDFVRHESSAAQLDSWVERTAASIGEEMPDLTARPELRDCCTIR